MSRFSEIKSNIQLNIGSINNTFWTDEDIEASMQDGYDDISILTRCVVKRISFAAGGPSPYVDIRVNDGVQDFLAVIAIWDITNQAWLDDSVTIRDFDKMRDDWELWKGTPRWWAAVNFQYFAIVPTPIPSAAFDLFYWSTAPRIDFGQFPLLPKDLHKLVEYYSTPDLLEQAEEYTKANEYWKLYYALIESCADRFKNIARADLMRLA